MAIFKFHIESYRKGAAQIQSDYIWGRGDFSARRDVVAIGCGNLPDWCNGDPGVFFGGADIFERKNGSACRHLVLSLPRELDLQDWIRLVKHWIERDLGPKPYQWAIHNDLSRFDENPHVHIVYSDRLPDSVERSEDLFFRRPNAKQIELGGCRKDSGGKSPLGLRISLVRRKELWADLQNESLQAAGIDARVDHRN